MATGDMTTPVDAAPGELVRKGDEWGVNAVWVESVAVMTAVESAKDALTLMRQAVDQDYRLSLAMYLAEELGCVVRSVRDVVTACTPPAPTSPRPDADAGERPAAAVEASTRVAPDLVYTGLEDGEPPWVVRMLCDGDRPPYVVSGWNDVLCVEAAVSA